MCISLVINGTERFLCLFIWLYFTFSESWAYPVLSFSSDTFKMWTNQPVFGVAKIIFSLALGMGFLLTVWLHLPYLPGLQRVPRFGLIGTIMCFCEGAPQLWKRSLVLLTHVFLGTSPFFAGGMGVLGWWKRKLRVKLHHFPVTGEMELEGLIPASLGVGGAVRWCGLCGDGRCSLWL